MAFVRLNKRHVMLCYVIDRFGTTAIFGHRQFLIPATPMLIRRRACSRQPYTVSRSRCVFVTTGCVSVILLAMSALALTISRVEPAESHSVRSVVSQLLLQTLLSVRGRLVLRRLRHASTRLPAVQTSVLSSVLKRNAGTSFGRRNRFGDVLAAAAAAGGSDAIRRSYVATVPLTAHEDYADDVRRLFESKDAPAAGLLTADRVEFLTYSSGTTGKNKLVPVTRWFKVSITGGSSGRKTGGGG